MSNRFARLDDVWGLYRDNLVQRDNAIRQIIGLDSCAVSVARAEALLDQDTPPSQVMCGKRPLQVPDAY